MNSKLVLIYQLPVEYNKGLPQTRILGLDLQKFLRQTAQEELRQQIKLRQNLNQPETTK